jgi:alpha-L-rhamnosidase
MTTWLDYGIPRSDSGDRLWKEDTLQLGDWLDPSAPPDDPGDGRTDPLLAANAYLCHVTKTVAKVSQILGKTSEAERYEADYLKVRESFRREYVTRSGRIVSDSQTGIALALRFGLVDSYEAEHAVERLAFLISKKHFKIGTGFAGTPIILQTLADHGKLAVAYRMLQEKKNPSWLYSVSRHRCQQKKYFDPNPTSLE